MKNLFYLFFLVTFFHSQSIAQCDEYYVNELIAGNDDECPVPDGSPVRFCPRLNGIAVNGVTFDVSQWDGTSTQYLTLTKNGGIAGTMVLKLKERELKINFHGCGGSVTYSISIDKSELQNFYTKKDQTVIEEINSLVSKKEYEKAFDLTSKLLQKSNYNGLSELEKICNEKRLSNYRTLISKTREEITDKNYFAAAEIISQIKLPTNLDRNQTTDYRKCKNTIENELKNLYADSVVIVNEDFQFSDSDVEFKINNKNIRLDKEILSHLDSLTDGNYFLRISKTTDRYYREVLNYDIVASKFGVRASSENGSLWINLTPEAPASKLGLPSKFKLKSIDGISFTNVLDCYNYMSDKETMRMAFWDTLTNNIKEQELNRGWTKIVSLPGDQSKCTRWMQGGGCVNYYTANVIEGWSMDSLKTIALGIFNLSVANLIPFEMEIKIENPTIEYYTKTGENLKLVNESFYRKVKGHKSLSVNTISNQKVTNNWVVKSQFGNCNYSINGKLNYTSKNKRINKWFEIKDLLPKSN